ncbi:SDR family oxidoreductase [Rhodococcus jostii]|uniref:SDR family oxidoreductase n=1 Tax=Rhodococcus jostii TaxID=132919 RepID=UPI003084364C
MTKHMQEQDSREIAVQTDSLFDVRGKTVLVTGGGRGIGRGLASAFVSAGARVYVCSRDYDACKATADELANIGECIPLSADLGTYAGCEGLVGELSVRETSLDVVINNAGALWAAPLIDYPENGWDKVFDLNVKGTFFLIRGLLPLLAEGATMDSPARVINIGSIDGLHVPAHDTYAYSASKAAVHHLSRHLARELADRHVTVNVIAPGMYLSKMMQATVATKGADAVLGAARTKRFVDDSDMAGAAIYLASRAGAYVTGTVLPVDGGMATTL